MMANAMFGRQFPAPHIYTRHHPQFGRQFGRHDDMASAVSKRQNVKLHFSLAGIVPVSMIEFTETKL